MSASPAAGRRQRQSQQLPARRCTEQNAPGLSPPGVLLPPGSGCGLQASLFLAHFGLKAQQKLVKYAVLTALEKKINIFIRLQHGKAARKKRGCKLQSCKATLPASRAQPAWLYAVLGGGRRGFFPRSERAWHSREEPGVLRVWTAREAPAELAASAPAQRRGRKNGRDSENMSA